MSAVGATREVQAVQVSAADWALVWKVHAARYPRAVFRCHIEAANSRRGGCLGPSWTLVRPARAQCNRCHAYLCLRVVRDSAEAPLGGAGHSCLPFHRHSLQWLAVGRKRRARR